MPQRHSPAAMLDRLVAFPTVSSRTNLDLVDFVEDYLASHGVPSLRIPDATGRKASLVALIGPSTAGGVVLSGHSDVVPVDGQDWTCDPWKLTPRDDRLVGRGTTDMKGFCATALALVPEMLAAGLRRPILIALSRDEEIGCVGAPEMIDAMLATLPPPEIAIVGEPTMMQVVTGHKAGIGLATHVRGHEVHSSVLDRGVSAVMNAARLVTWLEDRMIEGRSSAPARPGDELFDPPYTTLHVGQIHGGTANNITARDCRFVADIRVLPSEDPAAWEDRYRTEVARLQAKMRQTHRDATITVERAHRVPGCHPEPDGPAERLARLLTGDNATRVVSYGTEAGQFQERGLSTVVCGPGSIDVAHQPDEFITLDQMAQAEAFMRRLIAQLAA